MSSLSTATSMFEDVLVRIVLPSIVDGLATRGYTIRVEDLMSMLRINRSIPSQQSTLTPIAQTPLMVPNMPLMGGVGSMAIITQPSTNNKGRAPRKTTADPQFKCFYQIRPNNQGGLERRCGKARLQTDYFCKSCSTKNKAKIDFTAGKLDLMIQREMGEEYMSTRINKGGVPNTLQASNVFGNPQNTFGNPQNTFGTFGSQSVTSFQPLSNVPTLNQVSGYMSFIPPSNNSSNSVPSINATNLEGYTDLFVMNSEPKFVFRQVGESKRAVIFAKLVGKSITSLNDQDKKAADKFGVDVVNTDPDNIVKVNDEQKSGLLFPSISNIQGSNLNSAFPSVQSNLNSAFPSVLNSSAHILPMLPPLIPINNPTFSTLTRLDSLSQPTNNEPTSKILSSELVNSLGPTLVDSLNNVNNSTDNIPDAN